MTDVAPIRRHTAPERLRFTVQQYYTMADAGVFDGLNKVELLDGEIVVVNSQWMPHTRAKMAVYDHLRDAVRMLGLSLEVLVEGAVEIGSRDVPEPDVFVWEPVATDRAALGDRMRLVVEVAASSRRIDLGRKRLIYARAAVPEYWVVDLKAGKVERFTEVADGDYRRHDSLAIGGEIASLTLPGVRVPAGVLA